MNQLNSILLEGTLIGGPLLGETAGGSPVCNFTVGSTRETKDENGQVQRSTIGVRVRTWKKLAEVCNEFLSPGRGVRIVGRLAVDCMNGHEEVYIAAEHVEFKPKEKTDGQHKD